MTKRRGDEFRSKLAIVADDLTGACDAAARFPDSRVCFALPPRWPSDVDVLAVDLDIRERASSDARPIVVDAVRQVRELEPAAGIFVKIDSTLRGPLTALVVAGSPSEATQVQLGRLLPTERVVVLRTPAGRERDNGEHAEALATAACADTSRSTALVMTGGATARLVCTKLGAQGLQVLG